MAPARAILRPGARELTGVDVELEDPAARIQQFTDFAHDATYRGFDRALLTKHLHLVSASADGTSTFTFTVPAEYCNRMGNMHGGAAALLMDVCTTTALLPISRPGYWQFAGVSASLNVTYLRPVPCGARVEIVSSVVSAGKRLAILKGEICLDGKVLVAAQHMKTSIDPPVAKL